MTGGRKSADSWFRPAVARGLAFFLGVFSLLNVLGDLLSPGFDANHWWIDLRPIHSPAADVFLAGSAFFLLAYSVRPVLSSQRKILTYAFLASLLFVTMWNAVMFYTLVIRRAIRSVFPVAFSVFVAAAIATVLVCVGEQTLRRRKRPALRSTAASIVTVLICVVVFPFAQMFCFGLTDYRRQADVIVVFGAAVHSDTTGSNALADRVRTGCELYLDGLAKRIIFSGGPGEGDIHQTEAMREMALKSGVAPQAIILDTDGLTTRATVRNTCAMFDDLGIRRVLAVSNFYHLPRIQMSYQRQDLEVSTVPAKESCRLTATAYFVGREIAALWIYHLRPLASLVLPGQL